MNSTFLKFHLEDRKEDMKKKWKILSYLDDLDDEVLAKKHIVIPKKNVNKYSISRLRKMFGTA